LIPSNQVHPYHLLRYETAIFSKPALEKLQDSLKAKAPKRKAEVA
jgi:large subunit ribosomal protein L4